MSISEIISKRFKHKIKVNEAQTADDVERMIIRPPEAANSDFENSILTFLNDPKGVWVWSDYFGAHFKNLTGDMALYMKYKQNRIKSLAKRVKDSYPLSFRSEATPTDVLMQV